FSFVIHRPTYSLSFLYTTLFRSGASLSGEWKPLNGSGAMEARYPVLNTFYTKEAELLHVNKGKVYLSVNPVLSLEGWYGEEEARSEEHTSELQSRENLVCRRLLE